MKKIPIFRWLFSAVLYLIIAVVLLMLVMMLVFGLKLYCVQTGSMEPTYPVGAMIVVEDVEPTALETGDVITFTVGDGTVVTHRIVGIDRQTRQIETKGDNNNAADSSQISYENVIGRVKFGIPAVGYAVLLLKTNFGRIMAGVFIVAVIGVNLIVRMYDRDCEEDEKEQSEESQKPDGSGQL